MLQTVFVIIFVQQELHQYIFANLGIFPRFQNYPSSDLDTRLVTFQWIDILNHRHPVAADFGLFAVRPNAKRDRRPNVSVVDTTVKNNILLIFHCKLYFK